MSGNGEFSAIECKVPGVQKLRSVAEHTPDEPAHGAAAGDAAGAAAEMHYVYSPVITVTKAETTFTKGDLKLQKVHVTEDVSDDSASTDIGMLTVAQTHGPAHAVAHAPVHGEVLSVPIRKHRQADGNNAEEKTRGDERSTNQETKNTTKIPKLKFKQVIERVRTENRTTRDKPEPSSGHRVRSSIPRLKDFKNSQPSIEKDLLPNDKRQKLESPKLDDEFDKLYEEIIESEVSNDVPSPEKISNPVKLECTFEEIIHAYDGSKTQSNSEEKPKSKIPLLKRKSEQEIEVPPPTARANSLKNSNPDYSKGTLPAASFLHQLKPDIGIVNHTHSTEPNAHEADADAGAEDGSKNCKSFERVNSTPVVKSVTTHKSSEEFKSISSPESSNVVQSDNFHDTNIEDILKCKVPAAATDGALRQINSATLNKLPTRSNLVGQASSLQFTADAADQIVYKKKPSRTMSHCESNVESSYSQHLTEHETSRGAAPTRVDKRTLRKQRSLQEGHSQFSYIPSQVKHMQTGEARNKIFDMPAISSMRNKFEKIETTPTKDIPSENLSDPHDFHVTVTEKPRNNISHLPKYRRQLVTDQTGATNHHNNATTYELENENTYSTGESPSLRANEGTRTSSKAGRTLVVSDETFTNTSEKQQILIKSEGDENTEELTVSDAVTTPTSAGGEESQHDTSTVPEKALKVSTAASAAEPTLDSPVITAVRENNTLNSQPLTGQLNAQSRSPAGHQNIPLVPSDSDHHIRKASQPVFQNVQVQDKLENDSNVRSAHDEAAAEEDIVVVKGIVSRIIKRLDSKPCREHKREIEDAPTQVSVTSKIAIFEKSVNEASLKGDASADHRTIESSATLPHRAPGADARPKVVNEILKTSSVDWQRNRSHDSDERLVSAAGRAGHAEHAGQAEYTTANEADEFFAKREMSSLDVWNEYRRNKELESDIRRAKSLAELDLGDAVRGRVKQMVVRMNSVDRMNLMRREAIELKEKPRAGAVSQRIALFERKPTPARGDDHAHRTTRATAAESKSLDEEELMKRIAELNCAREKYGPLASVKFVELSDGALMPALALGTAMLEPKLVKHVVSAAVELGFRAFDTAYIYGNEADVGRALRDKIQDGSVTREELFIINKLWSTFHRRELAEKACRQSLDAMGLDYFDLYLIHNPMSFKEGPNPVPRIAGVLQYSDRDYLEAWFGLERLVADGLVRRVGLSNFNSAQLERVVEKGRVKPVVNQVECHPYLNQLRLEEFCLSRNVKLSCFGVLGSKGTPRELTSGQPPAIDDPLVQVMAAGLGVTPAQLLVSYQLQLGRAVVVKCSSAAHLSEARAPVPLDRAQVAALNALNRNKRTFTFKGMGDTHRNYPFRIPF